MEFNWECIPRNPTKAVATPPVVASVTKSDVKGVTWNKLSNKWEVGFTKDYKKTYLGTFRDKKTAEGVAINYRKAHPWSIAKAQQKKLLRGGTSKYKGVSWQTGIQKWKAGLQRGQKNCHLGCFLDEKDAALAYDKAAYEAWGDECYLNHVHFPEDFE